MEKYICIGIILLGLLSGTGVIFNSNKYDEMLQYNMDCPDGIRYVFYTPVGVEPYQYQWKKVEDRFIKAPINICGHYYPVRVFEVKPENVK